MVNEDPATLVFLHKLAHIPLAKLDFRETDLFMYAAKEVRLRGKFHMICSK